MSPTCVDLRRRWTVTCLAAALGWAGCPRAGEAQPTPDGASTAQPSPLDAGVPSTAPPGDDDAETERAAAPPETRLDGGVGPADGGAPAVGEATADAGPPVDPGPDGGAPRDGGVTRIDGGTPEDAGAAAVAAPGTGKGSAARTDPDSAGAPERRRRRAPARDRPRTGTPEDAGGGGDGGGSPGPPDWLAPLLPRASPAGSVDVGALLAVLLLFGLARLTARLRRSVRQGGLVDRALALVLLGSRLGLTAAAVLLLAALVPGWVGPVALAALVAVGWSVRDVAPDVLAGLVLLAERRVVSGTEISAGDVRGVVASRGLRATVLRDERGRRVTVPNRLLLRTPLSVRGDGGRVHEAAFLLDRLGDGPPRTDASTVRRALFDTVITSPWVPAHARPEIRQDAERSGRWWVRTELLDSAFVARFDGELLERLRERLPRPQTPRDAAAAERDDDVQDDANGGDDRGAPSDGDGGEGGPRSPGA